MEQTAFLRGKNGEYIPRLKYAVPIFVEQIYKIQHLEVSGFIIRFTTVKYVAFHAFILQPLGN